MAKKKSGQPVRSAERMLTILKSFSSEKPERTIAEISEELELAPSTVRRLLLALENHGFLRQDDRTGRFSLSWQVLRLAAVAMETVDIVRQAGPILDRLLDETGESLQLTVLDEDMVVHLDGRESDHTFRVFHPAGHRHPANQGSASGKVLLAWLDDDDLDDVLDEAEWRQRTPSTITDPDRYRAELAAIRSRGYATNDGETEVDVWAVAAPVHDHTGEVVAAINVPVPMTRASKKARQKELVAAVTGAARSLSAALGYRSAA